MNNPFNQMTLAIMQPYFLPYIGYFQLIACADTFVVYDNIKYTKKGWINRNRYLRNGEDVLFSLPLKKDSDFLNVCEREVSDVFDRKKLLNQITGAYRPAPNFETIFPLIEKIIQNEDRNLFGFIYQSILEICSYLKIETCLRVSSQIDIDHNLRSQDKVLALCTSLKSDEYVNSIGGRELYSKSVFLESGINLKFLESNAISYEQLGKPFVPGLSILDVLMFNDREKVRSLVCHGYEIV